MPVTQFPVTLSSSPILIKGSARRMRLLRERSILEPCPSPLGLLVCLLSLVGVACFRQRTPPALSRNIGPFLLVIATSCSAKSPNEGEPKGCTQGQCNDHFMNGKAAPVCQEDIYQESPKEINWVV